MDEIIKNPKKLKNVKEISIKYLLTTTLAEKYSLNKIDLKKINEFIKILDEMDNPEFVVLLIRLCSQYTKDKKDGTSRFVKEFGTSKELKMAVFDKYLKYL
ncbi:hypothetical protein LCGC14_2519800 [marine sediment metagenome]|uniref:Uncharacterized protein n=1 Tax=marine sediment metagenome TaxID=412755 RepID=A0A0F9AX48_9ZZZZ